MNDTQWLQRTFPGAERLTSAQNFKLVESARRHTRKVEIVLGGLLPALCAFGAIHLAGSNASVGGADPAPVAAVGAAMGALLAGLLTRSLRRARIRAFYIELVHGP